MMGVFEAAERVRASPIKAWSLAAVAFTVALILRFVFDEMLPAGFPYLTFFPAVILTTFFAGLLPGVVCAVLCGLSAWYWFIPPFGSLSFNGPVVIALLFYAGVVSVDILIIQLMHRAMDGLKLEKALSQELLAQQKTREKRQRVLQRELSHRMKNTLAMVQAVISQSLRHATSVEEAGEVAAARIQALGRSQDMLTDSNWQAADICYVVDATLEPHTDRSGRFTIVGPSLDLNATQSMGLALLLHELATNALKYGALSTPTGQIRIGWELQPDAAFTLTWHEQGGPAVTTPARRGFGSRLIERVVPGYLGGTAHIDYQPSGVMFTLEGVVTPEDVSDNQQVAVA